MGRISADTFRRAYLLYLLGRFRQGSFGQKRLQKITYISEREDAKPKPFEYKRSHFGQFSDQLEDMKEQLLSMGYIAATPLETAHEGYTGNRICLVDQAQLPRCRRVLASVSSSLPDRIKSVVSTYGYWPEQKLVDFCYALPEFQGLKEGDTICESDLPDMIEVDLSDDECDDIEVSLNPSIMMPMLRLAEAFDETEIDWSKVQEVEHLRSSVS